MNLSICLKSPMQPVVEWGCLLRPNSWKPFSHKWRSRCYNGFAVQSLGNFQSLNNFCPRSTLYLILFASKKPILPRNISLLFRVTPYYAKTSPRQRGRFMYCRKALNCLLRSYPCESHCYGSHGYQIKRLVSFQHIQPPRQYPGSTIISPADRIPEIHLMLRL